MKKWTICVDFDGTIVEHRFPEIGPIYPGAKEALQKLSEKYTIVISSCRASALFRKLNPESAIPDQHPPDGRDYVKEMEDFLVKNEIPFDRIDRGDEGKVVAVAYIDDRAVHFNPRERPWPVIAEAILDPEEALRKRRFPPEPLALARVAGRYCQGAFDYSAAAKAIEEYLGGL